MSYRDDRRALRLRNEQLERELEDARRELEQLQGDSSVDEADGSASVPSVQKRTGSGSAIGALVLIALGVGLVVLLRAPVPVAAGTALVTLGVVSLAVGRLLHVARPNEALVLSGRKRKLRDGSVVGYRIARGRVLQSPFVESATAIDLSVMKVPVALKTAYCRDGGAVDIAATAQVKVSSDPTILRNAVERFLDLPRESVALAAVQTLEGSLREILASVDLDDLDRERLQLNRAVISEVRDDFHKLGLELVGLWIVDVDDDDGELTRRRRKRAATELRRVETLSHEARQS